jgi:hypothetical protein
MTMRLLASLGAILRYSRCFLLQFWTPGFGSIQMARELAGDRQYLRFERRFPSVVSLEPS